MKKLIPYFLFAVGALIVAFPTILYPLDDAKILFEYEVKHVERVINQINEDLDEQYVNKVAVEIITLSDQYNIPEHVIITTVAHESRFDPLATNPNSNATGLGQIIPYWWGKKYNFEKKDLFNWEFNLEVTVKILRDLKGTWGHRRNWVANYYSCEPSAKRMNYYRQWKIKNRRIRMLLSNRRV